jgi:hypothetical protein
VFGLADKVILADGAKGVNPQNMVSAGTNLTYFVVEWRTKRPIPAPTNQTAIYPASSSTAASPAIRLAIRCWIRQQHAARQSHPVKGVRTLAPVAISSSPPWTGTENQMFQSSLWSLV